MSVVHTVIASTSNAIDPTSMSVQRRRRLRRRARDESGADFTFTSLSRNVGWSSLGLCLTNSNGAGRPCRGAMLISRCALRGRPDRCRRSASGSEARGAPRMRAVLFPSGDRLGPDPSGGGSSWCVVPPRLPRSRPVLCEIDAKPESSPQVPVDSTHLVGIRLVPPCPSAPYDPPNEPFLLSRH